MSGMVLRTYSHQRQLIDGLSITYISCLWAPTHLIACVQNWGNRQYRVSSRRDAFRRCREALKAKSFVESALANVQSCPQFTHHTARGGGVMRAALIEGLWVIPS